MVTSAYGFSGSLGGGPYDRRSVVPTAGDPGPAIPNTVADPLSLGALLRVPSPGINTITSAIAGAVAALSRSLDEAEGGHGEPGLGGRGRAQQDGTTRQGGVEGPDGRAAGQPLRGRAVLHDRRQGVRVAAGERDVVQSNTISIYRT